MQHNDTENSDNDETLKTVNLTSFTTIYLVSNDTDKEMQRLSACLVVQQENKYPTQTTITIDIRNDNGKWTNTAGHVTISQTQIPWSGLYAGVVRGDRIK